MDREQAVALLKELVAQDLIEPSHISIGQRSPEHYQIQIRNDYNRQHLDEFVKKHKLSVSEDKEKKYLRISELQEQTFRRV